MLTCTDAINYRVYLNGFNLVLLFANNVPSTGHGNMVGEKREKSESIRRLRAVDGSNTLNGLNLRETLAAIFN